ncbi:MAG: hypothetical protein ACJARZ_002687 [Dokdonia sp.]|jgi:hypothetical protein
MKYFAFALCLFLAACSSDDDSTPQDEACSEEFIYGLVITVNDAATGAGLNQVVITAREPSFSEVLVATPTAGVYQGAGERVGSYTLTVELDGYQTVVTDVITVEADACHVITQARTFTLQTL